MNPSDDKINLVTLCYDLIKVNNIREISMKELQIDAKKISEGGQAKIYKGLLDGTKDVAVKLLTKVDWKCLANELVIIANLDHPNIPKFHGIMLENNKVELIFDFIDGNSLQELKSVLHTAFNDAEKLAITKDLASVLEYVHTNSMVHRDLKPANIMINKQKKPFLIDFGVGKVLLDSESIETRAFGTLSYVPPEVFDGELKDYGLGDGKRLYADVTPKYDVWAFGCIISFLFSGNEPWTPKYSNSETVIMQNLKNKIAFTFSKKKITYTGIVEIIQAATNVDLAKRADMTEIVEALKKIN